MLISNDQIIDGLAEWQDLVDKYESEFLLHFWGRDADTLIDVYWNNDCMYIAVLTNFGIFSNSFKINEWIKFIDAKKNNTDIAPLFGDCTDDTSS